MRVGRRRERGFEGNGWEGEGVGVRKEVRVMEEERREWAGSKTAAINTWRKWPG